jgi:curli biogenesis system outer membrane secretion channel CsgG
VSFRRDLAVVIAATALGALTVPLPAAAQQEQSKKVLVIDFDQQQVEGGLHDVFGADNVNVGRSLAQLVAARLAERGFTIVHASGAIPFTVDAGAAAAAGRSAGADAVVAGTVIAYGSASGQAGIGGPRIGGIRLNVGRRTTIAVVTLEARLVDVTSGTLLGVVPASAQGSKSGLGITVSVPNLVDASGVIDMTRDDFRRTLVGQFTDSSVTQLVAGVADMRGRIGAVAAPRAPVAAAAVTAVPAAAAVPSGPVTYPSGAFAFAPYRFRGTEHFRYDASQLENRDSSTGYYTLDLQPAGPGQARMTVQGQLGTDQFQSSVTLPLSEGGLSMPQMMMAFMPLSGAGPLFVALFNPTSWMVFGGRQLTIGDGWQNTHDGETLSVRVESQCDAGGQGGVLVVTRENNQVRQESCLSPTVALPLRVMIASDDGDRIQLTLTEYRP